MHQLHELCQEARKLGSSAGILSASVRLRDCLACVLHLFRQNALKLHPEDIQVHIDNHSPFIGRPRESKSKNARHRILPAQPATNEPENLAIGFRRFSEDVRALFECFLQFTHSYTLLICCNAPNIVLMPTRRKTLMLGRMWFCLTRFCRRL